MSLLRPTLVTLLAIAATAASPSHADEESAAKERLAQPAAGNQPAAPTAAPPATQSVTLEPDAIRAAVAELNHPDAAVRRLAFERLMGMTRADLDAFRAVVDQARPLLPSQAAVLREIVTQAFLSGESYTPMPKAGFLGVKLQVVAVNSLPIPVGGGPADGPFILPPDGAAAGTFQVGILITERVPGFCGARSLVEGDVILSIVGRRLRLTADRLERDIATEFSVAVREFGPGKTVTFELLRQGRVMRVPVKLDPRPETIDPAFGANESALDDFKNDRSRKADRYWNETFRPLLGEQVG